MRSPTFALMGYVVFSMGAAKKKQWSLNNVSPHLIYSMMIKMNSQAPSMSPLEGIVEMCTCCDLTLSVEHRGFLTMFEDISGFGAWHRRWCLLKGDTLNYWKYPDNEKTMVRFFCFVDQKVNLLCAATHQLYKFERLCHKTSRAC